MFGCVDVSVSGFNRLILLGGVGDCLIENGVWKEGALSKTLANKWADLGWLTFGWLINYFLLKST